MAQLRPRRIGCAHFFFHCSGHENSVPAPALPIDVPDAIERALRGLQYPRSTFHGTALTYEDSP